MKKRKANPFGLPREILLAAWAIALGAIAPMLDSTMVNIAIDKLTKDFHTTLPIIQWAVTGYLLALAIAVPVCGWMMNHFNGKRVYLGSVIAFAIISVFAGVSWNVSSFIFFRLIQGFSAGIITTLMSTLLVKTAGHENLGRVMAIVSTPMIFGPILGPILGGFIVQVASWHWIFFINVFFALLTVPFMAKNIPDFEPFKKDRPLDRIGILLLAIMSSSLIYGITQAAEHASFSNHETYLWVGIGLAFAISYMLYNRIKKNKTVLPLNLFKHRTYSASTAGLLLANISIMGPMLIIPLFFQNFRQYTAIETALALIPQGIGMLVTRPLIGRMIDKIGAKYVVIVSLLVSLIGTIPLIFITDKTSIIWISILLFIRGTSFGGIMLPMTSDAYTGLQSEQLPEAGVGITIIENLGSSLGIAFIATVVSTVQGTQATPITSLSGYHAGFFASIVVLGLTFIPVSFLTHKKTTV